MNKQLQAMKEAEQKKCGRFQKVITVSWPNPKAYCRVDMTIEDLKAEIVRLDDLAPQWVSVETSKPKQGERVLLRTLYDDHCPCVVGYWGSGVWEACTINVVADEDYNGNIACVERSFMNEDVTHWQPLPAAPEGV